MTATLLFLFGPPATGKMTVGQEIARRTGFKLYHNHQTIDLVTEYFAFGSEPFARLVSAYRQLFVEEAARAGLSFIATGGWCFQGDDDTNAVREFIAPFVAAGHRVCFAELIAPFETRLARNQTENRRRHKKTDWATEQNLRAFESRHILDSGGSIPFDAPFLRIENAGVPADSAADRIITAFALPVLRDA